MGNKIKLFFKKLCFHAVQIMHRTYQDPYVVRYENTSDKDAIAILFGYNDNFTTKNFGNPECIEITNLQGGSYGRLLGQTFSHSEKIGKWSFHSNVESQLQINIQTLTVDANGKEHIDPFINLRLEKDVYQFQSDVLDVNKDYEIDSNSIIRFKMLAFSKFNISMFPYRERPEIKYYPRTWYVVLCKTCLRLKDFIFGVQRRKIKALKERIKELENLVQDLDHQAFMSKSQVSDLLKKYDPSYEHSEYDFVEKPPLGEMPSLGVFNEAENKSDTSEKKD